MGSCSLTGGLPIVCKDAMTGIKQLYIANFENVTDVTFNNTNVATGITLSAGSFYTFNLLKEAADFTEPINVSPQNGTSSYKPTLNMYLSKFSTSVRNVLVNLVKAKLMIIFLDRNNQYWICGYENGMDMSAGNGMTGKAYSGEQNGWTMTFDGDESVPAREVSASIISAIISA